ncbi:type II toxin-antitoxin system VapB family antitoxin [Pseudokineococcus sp. 5B2Z-1]|uniref:type II toxin-antitoxin system VapB family antitoxin n=1 Tax=Pseudokineococcus sp. 5B2Z-1 TaxID=3132744 RepID=UPI00309E1DAD
MRTTLNLADGLMAEVKQRASQEGRTTTSFIEEALRAYLAAERTSPSDEPLPSWGSADGRVLVDLEDRDAVWAALDETS